MAKKKPAAGGDNSPLADLRNRLRTAIDGIPDRLLDRSMRTLQVIGDQLQDMAASRPHVTTAESTVDTGDRSSLIDLAEGGTAAERIINKSNFLPAHFLTRGTECQMSVARIVLLAPHNGLPAGSGWGTGFLVGPDYILTNNHVVEDKAFLGKIRVEFNFQLLPNGMTAVTENFFPDAAGTFRTNAGLDYTLFRLKRSAAGEPAGTRWGRIPLNPSPQFFAGQRLNVIQHPAGREKEVVLQDNEITELFSNVVRYEADTEPGSSGSPVFDNAWQLVALHHSAGRRASNGHWISNQGIRSDRIVADLRSGLTGASGTAALAELGL